jgi:hypothetical protein
MDDDRTELGGEIEAGLREAIADRGGETANASGNTQPPLGQQCRSIPRSL